MNPADAAVSRAAMVDEAIRAVQQREEQQRFEAAHPDGVLPDGAFRIHVVSSWSAALWCRVVILDGITTVKELRDILVVAFGVTPKSTGGGGMGGGVSLCRGREVLQSDRTPLTHLGVDATTVLTFVAQKPPTAAGQGSKKSRTTIASSSPSRLSVRPLSTTRERAEVGPPRAPNATTGNTAQNSGMDVARQKAAGSAVEHRHDGGDRHVVVVAGGGAHASARSAGGLLLPIPDATLAHLPPHIAARYRRLATSSSSSPGAATSGASGSGAVGGGSDSSVKPPPSMASTTRTGRVRTPMVPLDMDLFFPITGFDPAQGGAGARTLVGPP